MSDDAVVPGGVAAVAEADPFGRRVAVSATGLLATLNADGSIDACDVQLARRLGAAAGDTDERVLAAAALVSRSVRQGSVAVDVADLPDGLIDAVAGSRLLAQGAIVLEHDLLYLERYRALEARVAADLERLRTAPAPQVDEDSLAEAVARVSTGHFSAEQRAAALAAVRQRLTVLTGGPGTGKTTTIGRILALVADQAAARGERLRIALAAPTGKAAARMAEAVAAELVDLDPVDRDRVGTLHASTLHRLLGWRPDERTRFARHRDNPLVWDLIVVDECSMVDLNLMAWPAAVRDDARLVLSGDPQQLASVGAGAVLSDIVEGYGTAPGSPVAALRFNHRSEAGIRDLAEAVRVGDADRTVELLRAGSTDVGHLETDAPADQLRAGILPHALAVVDAAVAGDVDAALAALERHRLLCAHREGPFGVAHWNAQVESWLVGAGRGVSGWYPGRPLLITRNDPGIDVYNGEVGVVVEDGSMAGHPTAVPRAWIQGSDRVRSFAPSRLEAVETMHAMTIHKSQGSQADEVTVLLPGSDSRLLSRELFYTAITRARRFVRVVGPESAVRAAVEQRAHRATGLAQRLGRP